jgi:hypothetical protein
VTLAVAKSPTEDEIDPEKRFEDRMSSCKRDSFIRDDGKLPESRLSATSMLYNAVQYVSNAGRVPVRQLSDSFNSFNEENVAYELGILPCRLLLYTYRYCMYDIELKASGNVPVKLLSLKSNFVILCHFDIHEGMLP